MRVALSRPVFGDSRRLASLDNLVWQEDGNGYAVRPFGLTNAGGGEEFQFVLDDGIGCKSSFVAGFSTFSSKVLRTGADEPAGCCC